MTHELLGSRVWLRRTAPYSRLSTGIVGAFISHERGGVSLDPKVADKMLFTLVRLDPPANPAFKDLFFIPVLSHEGVEYRFPHGMALPELRHWLMSQRLMSEILDAKPLAI